MFEVTDEAKKLFDQHFAKQEVQPIRIYMAPG